MSVSELRAEPTGLGSMPKRGSDVNNKAQIRLNPVPGLILGAILLLVAITQMPYAYYIFMRWGVFAVSTYGAWVAYQTRHQWWIWLLGAIAALFNPIVPLHMRREDWLIFDLIGGALLLIGAVVLRKAPNEGRLDSE